MVHPFEEFTDIAFCALVIGSLCHEKMTRDIPDMFNT